MKNIFFLLLIMVSCKSTKTIDSNCKTAASNNCVCTQQYDPVCGCDNKTYANACAATCAGVKSFTKGECPVK